MRPSEKFRVHLSLVLPLDDAGEVLRALRGPTQAAWRTARSLQGDIARAAFNALPVEPTVDDYAHALADGIREICARHQIDESHFAFTRHWAPLQTQEFLENCMELAPDWQPSGDTSHLSAPALLPPPASVLEAGFEYRGRDWARTHWGTERPPHAGPPLVVDRPGACVAIQYQFETVGGLGQPLAAAVSQLAPGARVSVLAASTVDGMTHHLEYAQGSCVRQHRRRSSALPPSVLGPQPGRVDAATPMAPPVKRAQASRP